MLYYNYLIAKSCQKTKVYNCSPIQGIKLKTLLTVALQTAPPISQTIIKLNIIKAILPGTKKFKIIKKNIHMNAPLQSNQSTTGTNKKLY